MFGFCESGSYMKSRYSKIFAAQKNIFCFWGTPKTYFFAKNQTDNVKICEFCRKYAVKSSRILYIKCAKLTNRNFFEKTY